MTFLAVVGWVLFACALAAPAIRRRMPRRQVNIVDGIFLPPPDSAGWHLFKSGTLGFRINSPDRSLDFVVWNDGIVFAYDSKTGHGTRLGESPRLYRAILVAHTQNTTIKMIEGA